MYGSFRNSSSIPRVLKSLKYLLSSPLRKVFQSLIPIRLDEKPNPGEFSHNLFIEVWQLKNSVGGVKLDGSFKRKIW